jgi:hypothetical protein
MGNAHASNCDLDGELNHRLRTNDAVFENTLQQQQHYFFMTV